MANSAIGTPTFQAKAENIQNTDGSSIYNSGTWIFKNGSGTTNLFMDSSGLVGIGTASPTFKVDAALGSVSSATSGLRLSTSNIGNLVLGISQASTNMGTASTSADIYTTAGLDMRFGTNGAERMRIDANGNVGIGTASPVAKLDINGGIRIPALSSLQMGNGSTYIYTDVAANGSFIIGTSSTERMRIDASGVVNIGTSVTGGVSSAGALKVSFGYNTKAGQAAASYGANVFNINHGTGQQLWIDSTNMGTIAYTSDYRIKESIEDLQAGLERVKKLRPVSYKFKDVEMFVGSDELREGFIAHEVASIIPAAVQGQKDELTEDGKIQPQSLRLDSLIAVLTKAIQEQQAQIESLKSEIEALKLK